MSQKHFRRTLLASTSRVVLHRAWAALNQDALAMIKQEDRAVFAQALAAKDEPTPEPARRLHHNGEPRSP